MQHQTSDTASSDRFKYHVRHTFIEVVQQPHEEHATKSSFRRRMSEPLYASSAQPAAPLPSPKSTATPATPSACSSVLGDNDDVDIGDRGRRWSYTSSVDPEDVCGSIGWCVPDANRMASVSSTACSSEAEWNSSEKASLLETSWPFFGAVDDSMWGWPTANQTQFAPSYIAENSHPTMVCHNITEVLSTASPIHQVGSHGLQTASDSEILTTVMVRALPENLSRAALVQQLNEIGCTGLYDFVYMPMNFRGQSDVKNFGYAFINFRDPGIALNFMSRACGLEQVSVPDAQKWETTWSTCQGINQNIERYRNSPLMHELVPDGCKPAMFDTNGNWVPFPLPTRSIPKPRIHRAAKGNNADTEQQPREHDSGACCQGGDKLPQVRSAFSPSISPGDRSRSSTHDGVTNEGKRPGKSKKNHRNRPNAGYAAGPHYFVTEARFNQSHAIPR